MKNFILNLLLKIYLNIFTFHRILRCLIPRNNQHFPKFVKRIRQWFFVFQKFTTYYIFFAKRATGGFLYYHGIVSKEEKQNIRWSSSQ